MRESKFAPVVEYIKTRYNIRVKKWRSTMSGCAWRVTYTDGKVINWIESPYPKTLISLAIFFHEVGHHVIGFNTYKRRCEEEYHVWLWAMKAMKEMGIEPDTRVIRRFERSMRYAVNKALRRGLRDLPEFLSSFNSNAQAA
jgi:hypothetical protein